MTLRSHSYSKAFEAWWLTRSPSSHSFHEAACKDYAYQAWLAALSSGPEYAAIHLTRGADGKCEVAVEIKGARRRGWLTVISDSGEIISHIVEPLGIRRRAEEAGFLIADACAATSSTPEKPPERLQRDFLRAYEIWCARHASRPDHEGDE